MSTPRFVADLHLGHKNIWKYRPVFTSTLHNDLYFMNLLRKIANKRDSLYFVGDIAFDEKYLDFIADLPGTKILIPGNHCTEYVHMSKLVEAYDDIHALLKYKEFWISHAPIHADELRGKKNVHGHVHAASVEDIRYMNVSVDSSFSAFKPRTLEEVRSAFAHVTTQEQIYRGIPHDLCLKAIMSDPLTREAYVDALLECKRIENKEKEQ